jgi:hypothetical protein
MEAENNKDMGVENNKEPLVLDIVVLRGTKVDNIYGDFSTSMIRILGGSDWEVYGNIHFRI